MSEHLLDDLVAFIRMYVAMTVDQAVAVALWAAHAHAADAAEFTPYLAVTSAEKRSGKTLLLDLLGRLVPRPLSVANTSVSALFRSIEEDAPTLLFDEVDAVFTRNGGEREQELRGILNAGFRRGPLGTVLRTVGPQHTPMRFAVFCPKVLAGIGELPDTIADRSIAIRMKRKARGEQVQRMRSRDVEEPAADMRARIAAWVADVLPLLEEARPPLPDDLDDRAADIWEPLLAIADVASPAWAVRARSAAVRLSTDRQDGAASLGVRLLADVRAVLDARGVDRIASAELAAALNEMEESPWGGFGQGSGISPRGIARLLRPHDVVPGSVRMGDGTTPKGYLRERLEEVFDRYLSPAEGTSGRHTATTGMDSGISAVADPPQGGACGGSDSAEIPRGDSGVAVWRINVADPERNEDWRDLLPEGETGGVS